MRSPPRGKGRRRLLSISIPRVGIPPSAGSQRVPTGLYGAASAHPCACQRQRRTPNRCDDPWRATATAAACSGRQNATWRRSLPAHHTIGDREYAEARAFLEESRKKASERFLRSALLYLGQRRLGLREPERHLHGTVHLHGRGQFSTGLLPLAGGRIQRAETPVAVGHERAHAQYLG